MKRLAALVVAMVVVPASAAVAADLGELLERSQGASYTAEQIISCNTPDGVREGLVRLAQDGSEIWVGSTNGSGEWTLLSGGEGVSPPSVDSGDPVYVVSDESASLFLGRSAITYDLVRDDVLRAEIVFDQRTGALVEATTFLDDGSTYCQHRFVSFDSTPPNLDSAEPAEEEVLHEFEVLVTALPEAIAGFDRLDLYRDDDGSTFAYYSDGFFSFAVFETPTTVALPDGVGIDVNGSVYERSFTAGQATYVWETSAGGMAFVGDLPPDLHQSVLTALPESETPGIFRRLWRSLFG